jgi:hypothetical protein
MALVSICRRNLAVSFSSRQREGRTRDAVLLRGRDDFRGTARVGRRMSCRRRKQRRNRARQWPKKLSVHYATPVIGFGISIVNLRRLTFKR